MEIIDLTDTPAKPVVPKTYNRNTYWCGVYNYGGDEQPDDEAVLRWWSALEKIASYGIGGWEIAPSTFQKHLQFYVQLKPNQPKRLTELKKLADGSTVHWESCKGSDAANFDYCSKDGDYIEFGVRREADPGLREQNRWERLRELAQAGHFDAIDAQLFVQYYSAIRHIARDFLAPPPDLDGPADMQVGVWIYGPTGCGKSRYARTTYPEAYLKLANKWWDGYRDQPTVILEDFDKDHACLGHHLKIWADRYAFPMEIKGSYLVGRPKLFVVTSNYHPREIWGDAPGTLEPILRRFKLMPMGIQPELILPEGAPLGPCGTVIIDRQDRTTLESVLVRTDPFETPAPAKRQKTGLPPDQELVYDLTRPDTPMPSQSE